MSRIASSEALKLRLSVRLLPLSDQVPPWKPIAENRSAAHRLWRDDRRPDASWTRKCRVLDVSESGAKLALEEPGELPKDFVLMLSERGGPTRRCHVVWETGDQLGVEFERPKKSGAAA